MVIPMSMAAALMSSSAMANYLQNMTFEVPTCTGQFADDKYTLLVDCYSIDGVLTKRDEYFYSNLLAKNCSYVDYKDIKSDLVGWNLPIAVTNATGNVTLTECDYYEPSRGYVYSELNQGVGPVILNKLKNSTLSTKYEEMSDLMNLKWNWSSLKDIILGNCTNSTDNSTTEVPPGTGGGLPGTGNGTVDSSFLNVTANWQEFYEQSLIDGSYNSWSKAQWKAWMDYYGNYIINLATFQGVTAVDMEDPVLKHAYLQNLLNQPPIRSISSAKFWIYMYDFIELQTSLVSLNTTGVLSDFKKWYDLYFGANGIATIYYSQNESSNSNGTVPDNSTIPLPGTGSGSLPPTEGSGSDNSTLPSNIA